jgi:hypothetical protein
VAEARATAGGPAGGGGQVYAALVTSRMVEEDKRGSSLQARGLAVVTTSGTLVTLIFAVAQFVPGGRVPARIPEASRWLLAIAVAAFVAAAVGGLVTNVPRLLARPRLKDIITNIEWDGAGQSRPPKRRLLSSGRASFKNLKVPTMVLREPSRRASRPKF